MGFIYCFIEITRRVSITDFDKPPHTQAIEEPKSAEEFEERLNDWVVNNKLSQFFKPGDKFLPTLAAKAMELRKLEGVDPLATRENINRLVKVSLYKPILYCGMSTYKLARMNFT
jgi:hypothetical protein